MPWHIYVRLVQIRMVGCDRCRYGCPGIYRREPNINIVSPVDINIARPSGGWIQGEQRSILLQHNGNARSPLLLSIDARPAACRRLSGTPRSDSCALAAIPDHPARRSSASSRRTRGHDCDGGRYGRGHHVRGWRHELAADHHRRKTVFHRRIGVPGRRFLCHRQCRRPVVETIRYRLVVNTTT